MKFMPKKPMTIEQAYKAFCKEWPNCIGCSLDGMDNCERFCKENPEKAAKIMGFFSVDENTTTRRIVAHKNEKGEWELNNPPNFPSIKVGQKVSINEILADEQN